MPDARWQGQGLSLPLACFVGVLGPGRLQPSPAPPVAEFSPEIISFMKLLLKCKQYSSNKSMTLVHEIHIRHHQPWKIDKNLVPCVFIQGFACNSQHSQPLLGVPPQSCFKKTRNCKDIAPNLISIGYEI